MVVKCSLGKLIKAAWCSQKGGSAHSTGFALLFFFFILNKMRQHTQRCRFISCSWKLCFHNIHRSVTRTVQRIARHFLLFLIVSVPTKPAAEWVSLPLWCHYRFVWGIYAHISSRGNLRFLILLAKFQSHLLHSSLWPKTLPYLMCTRHELYATPTVTNLSRC